MLPAGHRPATSSVHSATSCNTQSSAPEDGQNNCPKHVELTGIINKPLLLYLVACLYYLYEWSTVKQISDNEIYLSIKYIKSVLWRVAKRLSYIEDARCIKVKALHCCLLCWEHAVWYLGNNASKEHMASIFKLYLEDADTVGSLKTSVLRHEFSPPWTLHLFVCQEWPTRRLLWAVRVERTARPIRNAPSYGEVNMKHGR